MSTFSLGSYEKKDEKRSRLNLYQAGVTKNVNKNIPITPCERGKRPALITNELTVVSRACLHIKNVKHQKQLKLHRQTYFFVVFSTI